MLMVKIAEYKLRWNLNESSDIVDKWTIFEWSIKSKNRSASIKDTFVWLILVYSRASPAIETVIERNRHTFYKEYTYDKENRKTSDNQSNAVNTVEFTLKKSGIWVVCIRPKGKWNIGAIAEICMIVKLNT